MIGKQKLIALMFLCLLLTVNVCQASVQLDEKFLKSETGNSSVHICVDELIETIKNLKLANNTHPKIIGWQRKGNEYTFTFVAGSKIKLKFVHLLNTGGEWSSIQVFEDGKPISPPGFLMQVSTMPHSDTKYDKKRAKEKKVQDEQREKDFLAGIPGEYREWDFSSQLFMQIDKDKLVINGYDMNYGSLNCQYVNLEVPFFKQDDKYIGAYRNKACSRDFIFREGGAFSENGECDPWVTIESKGDCSSLCTPSTTSLNKVSSNINPKIVKARNEKDYASIIEIYKSTRSPESSYQLAMMYLKGDEIDKNIDTAAGYLFEASHAGYLKATIALINLIEDKKVNLDRHNEISLGRLYESAANHNHAQAQFMYANMILGKSDLIQWVPEHKQYETGIYWLEKSANQGYAEAVAQLKAMKKE